MREMKDSRIGWVAEIPSHWEVKRSKYCFNHTKQIAGSNADDYERLALTMNGVIKRSKDDNNGLQPEKFETYQVLKTDQLVFKLIDLQNISTSRVGLSPYLGLVSPAYIVLNVDKSKVCPKFAEQYFLMLWRNQVFNALGDAGVRSSLNATELLELPIVLPPLSEQKRIADFLDGKCAEIDALVADIQSQIDTLEQYKRSVIFETLSNGIAGEPLVVTESSVWKKIPCSWKLTDIKYLFEIVKRIAGQEGFDVLSVTQKGLRVKNIHSNEGQLAENYSNYQFVYPTDYVMNHMDLLTGWVDCSAQFGVTSPDYRVFRLIDKQSNNLSYWKYVMQCCYLCRIFYSLGQGVSNLGRWRLQTSAFMNFKVPVPPHAEQKRIADFLDEKISKIDSIIDQKKEQLTVLENYKKSLIYEYVTGKKEVPVQ